jgi:23S rRNA (cytosine1962-C5)-methyltransferase
MPGREKSLLRRHPWVFASAIQDLNRSPEMGETVQVLSAKGEFLAWGAFSPLSKIRIRVWSWDLDTVINEEFFDRSIEQATALRKILDLEQISNAYRLVHAESDNLPGLIVDRYDDKLVVQFLASGVEYWRKALVGLLVDKFKPYCVYERSDADVRQLEGLPLQSGVIYGEEPPVMQKIYENDISYYVDIRLGHKTGFYLDQRANRRRLRNYVLNKDVLDCFSYSGGFSINALKGGAQTVLAIDASADALLLSKQNLQLNALPVEKIDWLEGDVFQVMRKLRDQSRSFDVIILDPPKFAPTSAQAERAAPGYKDINLLAFKLLRPGGNLITFSCSGGVSTELFQKIVADAALDAGVHAQILEHLHQGADHPIGLNFPEGQYLKGFVIRRL